MGDLDLDNGARVADLFAGRTPGHRAVAAHNFIVERISTDAGNVAIGSDEEMIVLFLAGGGRLASSTEDLAIEPYSVVITPPGRYDVAAGKGGEVIVLATARPDLDLAPPALDERVTPVRPFKRTTGLSRLEVRRISDIPFPKDNPRLKFLQARRSASTSSSMTGRAARRRSAPTRTLMPSRER